MRLSFILLLVLSLFGAPLRAQDLLATCHASSSYDISVDADHLLFDRPAPAPLRIELRQGQLRVDGAAVSLNAENRDRMALFERELRALLPRVRVVARNAVDMAARGIRAEADGMGIGAATRVEFERLVAQHAGALKQRVAQSHSTHDWQGAAAEQMMQRVGADLLPLLATDLAQQAVAAALSGDMQTAARLRDRATSLATELQPRMQQRMHALRPQIAALCPSIQRLAELQQGVRDNQGRALNLLQIQSPTAASPHAD